MVNDTEAVVKSHLQAAGVGVEAIMRDYTEESVLVTGDRTYRGPEEIREFFTALFNGPAARFIDSFAMNRQEFVGEAGYINWESKPWFPLATDTFVVRDGKIVFQTFTAWPA